MKAFVGFALAPVALGVAAVCVYALARLFTYKEGEPDKHVACLWIALASLPIMFLGNYLTPKGESLMEKRMREGSPMPGGSANKGEVMFHLLRWIMFTGPRLIDWGIASSREAGELQKQDPHAGAAILWVLMSRHKKVPYEYFPVEVPWLDLAAALPEVCRVPGVLQLQASPAGLGLTDDLRKAIRTGGVIEGH